MRSPVPMHASPATPPALLGPAPHPCTVLAQPHGRAALVAPAVRHALQHVQQQARVGNTSFVSDAQPGGTTQCDRSMQLACKCTFHPQLPLPALPSSCQAGARNGRRWQEPLPQCKTDCYHLGPCEAQPRAALAAAEHCTHASGGRGGQDGVGLGSRTECGGATLRKARPGSNRLCRHMQQPWVAPPTASTPQACNTHPLMSVHPVGTDAAAVRGHECM